MLFLMEEHLSRIPYTRLNKRAKFFLLGLVNRQPLIRCVSQTYQKDIRQSFETGQSLFI